MTKNELNNFKNKCAGKLPYATISIAEFALDNMTNVGVGEILEIYKCTFCNKYHIGHKAGTKKSIKRKQKVFNKIKYKLTGD